MNTKAIGSYLLTIGLIIFFSSCQTGRSDYMSAEQREHLQAAYDSLQADYKSLMAGYESDTDTLPEDLKSLYSQMQQMYASMDANHRQMMGGDRGNHMDGEMMMGRGMGMHMQGHMTGEWYSQMMAMHDQMARMHQQMNQQDMAMMNRRLSDEYGRMRRMLPGIDEAAEMPSDEEEEPEMLNGSNLYAANCASCHGNNARGVTGAFPPLINSEWVTGDKSIPVRILLHGLQGEIDVQGQTYQGIMPSFRARLSAAEIASILNYLREESAGEYPTISRQEVIDTRKIYQNRTAPWSSEELNE